MYLVLCFRLPERHFCSCSFLERHVGPRSPNRAAQALRAAQGVGGEGPVSEGDGDSGRGEQRAASGRACHCECSLGGLGLIEWTGDLLFILLAVRLEVFVESLSPLFLVLIDAHSLSYEAVQW